MFTTRDMLKLQRLLTVCGVDLIYFKLVVDLAFIENILDFFNVGIEKRVVAKVAEFPIGQVREMLVNKVYFNLQERHCLGKCVIGSYHRGVNNTPS